MNLNELTLGDLKSLMCLFSGTNRPEAPADPLVGQYVVIRGNASGVFSGRLVSRDGQCVILSGSRRLWKWVSLGGIALSGLAVHGVNVSESKIDTKVDRHAILDAIEVIVCSGAAQATLEGAP